MIPVAIPGSRPVPRTSLEPTLDPSYRLEFFADGQRGIRVVDAMNGADRLVITSEDEEKTLEMLGPDRVAHMRLQVRWSYSPMLVKL